MDTENTNELVNHLLQAITAKNWGLLASVGVMLLVQLVRKLVLPNVKVGWLADKRVTLGLGLLLAIAGGFATALIAGQAVTAALVVNILIGAVGTWLGAVGLFSAGKNLKEGGPQAGQPKGVASLVAGRADPMEKLK